MNRLYSQLEEFVNHLQTQSPLKNYVLNQNEQIPGTSMKFYIQVRNANCSRISFHNSFSIICCDVDRNRSVREVKERS